MNKALKIYLIIFGSIFGIILVVTLLWSLLLNSTLGKDRTKEDSFFDSFVSAHTDEDIVSYVARAHDLDVQIIDNHGPSNLKTGRGGVAQVKANDGMEFDVFINSFGAITGDNYAFLLAAPEIEHVIKNSEEVEEIKALGISEVLVLQDDTHKKLEVLLKNSTPLQGVDDEWLEHVFTAYQIVKEWNAWTESEYDVSLKTLLISYELPGGEEGQSPRLLVNMDEDIPTIEELEQHLIKRNHHVFTKTFLQEDMNKLDAIREAMPEMVDFVTNPPGGEMTCETFTSFDTCGMYRLTIGLHEDLGHEEYKQFRYDNEQVMEEIFEITQLIQTLELPDIELLVEELYVPDDLDNQTYTEEEIMKKHSRGAFTRKNVLVIHPQEVSSVEDLEFQEDDW